MFNEKQACMRSMRATVRVDTLLGKMACWWSSAWWRNMGVGCTDVTITYDDSHHNTSTTTSSQIYAEYLKQSFYDNVKYDLW